ncbi:type II toxin-antitoxin system RelE/ParE family toxin [Caldimonas caldifontis]|nr:type II toxin-antitoxin system RelE/ParE family toxin [Caldimonas caldifontis]
MRVLWTLAAEQDRADIVDFIAQDNPHAAMCVLALVHTAHLWPPLRP